MSDEVQKIKIRIHKLLQRTSSNGCTENEAMTAAALAGQLMDQYNLNITDIQILQTGCKREIIDLKNARSGPLGSMAVAIARYCDVKVWQTPGRRNHKGQVVEPGKLNFFGLESDVEMATYLLDIVEKACDKELAAFKQSDYWKENYEGQRRGVGRSATVGFKNGFSIRICGRFKEMKAERNEELRKRQEELNEALGPERRERTARNLVAVKTKRVEDEFRKLGISLSRGSRGGNGGDYSAYGQGRSAANNVGLHAGVGGQSQVLALK